MIMILLIAYYDFFHESNNINFEYAILFLTCKPNIFHITKRYYPGSKEIVPFTVRQLEAVSENFSLFPLRNNHINGIPKYLSNDVLQTIYHRHKLILTPKNMLAHSRITTGLSFQRPLNPWLNNFGITNRKLILDQYKKMVVVFEKNRTFLQNIYDLNTILEKNFPLPSALLNIFVEKLKTINTDTLTKEEARLLLVAKEKIQKYYEKRDLKEQYDTNLKKGGDEIQNKIEHFLQKEIPSRLFTSTDYEDEILRCKEGIELLKNYADKMSSAQIIQISVKAKILYYPEAFHKDVYKDNNNRIVVEEYIQKEAEGPKLTPVAWKILKNDSKLINNFPRPTSQIMNSIIQNIKEKKYIVGILDRKDLLNCEILAGIDLHFCLAVPSPEDYNLLYIIAIFTSVKNSETITLSKTQEFNNHNTQHKEQRLQIVANIIKICRDDFIKNSKATVFSRGLNKEGEDVNLKILNSFINKIKELEGKNIITSINITFQILVKLAEENLKNMLENATDDLKKYNTLSKEERDEFDQLRAKQKNNYYKKDTSKLSAEDKQLYTILDLIENLRLECFEDKIIDINKFE